MARHGENIRKRQDGRWEGRYLVYSAEKQKKLYRSVYGRTYAEVKTRLTTQKNLLKNPAEARTLPVAGNLLLTDLAKAWLEEIKTQRKPSTFVKYHLLYQRYIEKLFQNIRLSELTEALVKEKISSSFSDSIQKSLYCIINQTLKFAFLRYGIAVPAIKRPSASKKKRPVTVLSTAEQARLLAVLQQEMDCFKMAVLFCFYTGLRLGELCALKWEDLDFEHNLIRVNRTVQRLYAKGHKTKTILLETAPKSACSRREIPLSAVVSKLLCKFRRDTVYVFGGKKPMEPRTLQYHFKKLLQEAGLAEKNFHILRHTFATNCIEGGTDVKSLSELLGHSEVQITLNRYVHPSMETKRRHLDRLCLFYGQIYGQAS